MIVLDVNVLVAASRQDDPNHQQTHPWLQRLLSHQGANVIVPDLVWVGHTRIVTNRRIFHEPTTPHQAAAFTRAVCSSPGYLALPGLTAGIVPFLDLCVDANASANLAVDAYIASVAQSHACPVATFDRDFRRFDGLEIVLPGHPN